MSSSVDGAYDCTTKTPMGDQQSVFTVISDGDRFNGTNAGPLGWVSDVAGYRYQPDHPETGRPWPALPPTARAA